MSNHKTISNLSINQKATISGFTTDQLPVKLYEIGLLPGVEFIVKKKLPFNGPICIEILDNKNLIALRNSEANSILIETI